MPVAAGMMGAEVEAVAMDLLEAGKISPSPSSVLGQRRLSRSSVTYLIHSTLTQAEAEIEKEIGGVHSQKPASGGQEDYHRVDENDYHSIASEIECQGSAEDELQQELFAVEEAWKQQGDQQGNGSSLERFLFSSFEQRKKYNEETASEISEEDDDHKSASTASIAPYTALGQESNAVKMEALYASGLGLSLGIAADALASRMYRNVADSTRILPSYLQRQLTTSIWDQPVEEEDELSTEAEDAATDTPSTEPEDETTNNNAGDWTVGAPSLWTVGVPLLGSVSTTGNMMLFLNRLMEETAELD